MKRGAPFGAFRFFGYPGRVLTRSVVVALLLAGPALANPKAAAVHNRQAKAYFDAKQYDAAIVEFKKSYDLDKKPLTLFKIASAYYAKGDYENAIAFYGQYLQADPEGPYAAQALEFTTVAKKALDDERAKREAADAAAKKAEADKRAAEELEKKKLAAAGHIKNAQAFAQAGAWASAGDEYRAASDVAGDPAHLLDAAEAYRKQPDHAKASAAYRAYLDKAPTAPNADDVRKKLAESTRAFEEQEAKNRVAVVTPERRDEPEKPKGPPPITSGFSSFGPRVGFGISQADTNPFKMNQSDGLVFKPAFEVGAFARYQLHAKVAVRPEATIVYRAAGFDGDVAGGMGTMNDVVIIKRAGLAVSAPFYFSPTGGDGFRFGIGPMLAVMPYLSEKVKPGFESPGDTQLFDFGLITGIEIDFGLIGLDLRFTKTFGNLTNDTSATMYALLAGVTVGFEPSR